MSFAVVYPRTIRNGASFEQVADGDFLFSERQAQNFASSARDVGVNNHSVRDGSGGWKRRHGLRWTAKLGANFSEVFTRSGIIGGGIAVDAWFKGDEEITLTNDLVSDWGDLSGHNRDLSQGTPSNRPTTAELNGIQTLSTVSLKSMDFSSAIPVKSAVFVVNNLQPSTGGASSSVVFGETSAVVNDSDYTFLLINDAPAGYTISIDGNKGTSGNSSLDNGFLVSGQNIDLGIALVTGDGPYWFYVDWNDVSIDVGHISRFVTNLIDISGSMEFAEIIFFPTVLTEQQRTDVYEKYLKPLWGL